MPSSGRPRRPLLGLAILMVAGAAPTAGQQLPADGESAVARLEASPRHGEWIEFDAGGGDMVSAWVVHPERPDPAPVVVVIHEIFGMTDWIRAVADQAAAEGYIAIAPDLLSGKGPGGGGTSSIDGQAVGQVIRGLDRGEINRRLIAAANHAMAFPSAAPRAASVGFCWGGTTSFELALAFPELKGAVVYYGSSPATESLARARAPVLGLYGGNDNRVNATIEPARAELGRLGKRFEPVLFEGAGHGFLRQQSGQEGANLLASQQAWPRTVAFFREVLGR